MVILDVCTDDTAIWTPSPGGGVQGGLGGPVGHQDGQVVQFSMMGIKLKRKLKAVHLLDLFH